MSRAYSRRDFITGVLVCGTVSAAAVRMLPESQPAQSVELRLLTGADGTGARNLLIDMWNRANPRTRVVLDMDQGEAGDGRTHMEAAAANGTADIVNLDTIHLKGFIAKGLITPVEVDDETLFLPETLPFHQKREHNSLWAVPFNTDVGMLFERVDGDEPDKSLASVMGELTVKSNRLVGQLKPTSAGAHEAFVVNVLEHALSREPAILNPQGIPAYDPDTWRKALRPLRDALEDRRAVGVSSEADTIDAYRNDASLRYMRNWPVAFRVLQKKEDKDAMTGRIHVHPIAPGILGGQSLAAVSRSAHSERAKDVIRFLTGAEAQKIIAAYGLAPTRIAVYNDDDLGVFIPHLAKIRGAVEHALPRPAHADYPAFRRAIVQHVGPYLGKRVDLTDQFINDMGNALR